MEVCIDSVDSAVNAKYGGAARVELCANLVEGGTTPSVGILKVIKRVCTSLPVFVMIRPRGGDFLYNECELEVMKEDCDALKQAGADGFVFGILRRDGTVNVQQMKELIEVCRPLPVTFHRAIDMASNLYQALEDIIHLGCERVLTSGGDATVLEGLPKIKEMVKQAKGRIAVVAGGGINERNLPRILSGSGVKEFHCSARIVQNSTMSYRKSHISMGASFSPPEYSTKVADQGKVSQLVQIASDIPQN